MTRCKSCGQEIPNPVGRPRTVDDRAVAKLLRKGLSQREVARRLGISEAAVRKSMKRGKP